MSLNTVFDHFSVFISLYISVSIQNCEEQMSRMRVEFTCLRHHGSVDFRINGAHGWRQQWVCEAAQWVSGAHTGGGNGSAGNLL